MLFQLFDNEKEYHREWEYLRDTAPLVWHASSNEARFKKQEVLGVSAMSALHQSGILMKHLYNMRVDYIHRLDNTTFLRVMNIQEDKVQDYPNVPYPYVQEMSLQGSWKMEELHQLHEKYDYSTYKLRNGTKLKDQSYLYQQKALLKEKNVILMKPLQIRTFLVGDTDEELKKWDTPQDELCHEYNKYYTEDTDGNAAYLEIDLSKFGGNATKSK